MALRLNGEIISADSRQVFRGMDIGTGKDIDEYTVDGRHIPYHLIDIRDAGQEYSVYQFQGDFLAAIDVIKAAGHTPILCGGTGMYIESVVRGYRLADAPIDEEYRRSLELYTDEQLAERLASFIKLHNHTDTETRERLVRALEIQEFQRQHPEAYQPMPEMRHLVIGLLLPREVVVSRIGERLRQRLAGGMVEEVQRLIDSGVPIPRLLRYGLEYKNITLYLQGQCTYDEMYERLYAEIRRFSKRQMTWFRHMERGGTPIHWIDGTLPQSEQIEEIINAYSNL